MLYSILIYGVEATVAAWTPEEEDGVLGRHAELRRELAAERRLGARPSNGFGTLATAVSGIKQHVEDLS